MSTLYEPFFRDDNSHLSKFFYEPRNFTNQCDDPMDTTGMGVVPCRAICLTLTQEFVVMGRKTGKQLTMRGCASSLSRFGFYNRTLALFDQYDMCREVLASELFRYDTDSQPLLVCSCLGDRCNAGIRSFITPQYRHCLLYISFFVCFLTVFHRMFIF
ncbi:ly-6-related protein [Ditylenchus destructor]|nr:ly-6-related protein [Ditylenchus destructor]